MRARSRALRARHCARLGGLVRGENVARALAEKPKNTTAVIVALGFNGLATLSGPYYCLDGGTVSSGAVATTPAPARDSGLGTGDDMNTMSFTTLLSVQKT